MRVFQINTTFGEGSTGRIAEEIGNILVENGHQCCIAYGRGQKEGKVDLYRIGNQTDFLIHGFVSLLFDRHGLASKGATKRLIKKIIDWKPDVIHLHNIHGYYLNYRDLFSFFQSVEIPVIWTFHDCWPFTGHCTYFDNVNCRKWIDGCYACPKTRKYPRSLIVDRSKGNYFDKKQAFTTLKNLTVVTPSQWLQSLTRLSFFKNCNILTIHNGIHTGIFKAQELPLAASIANQVKGRKIILGVANIWDARKGLNEFIRLSLLVSNDYVIVLVGLEKNREENFPANILCIGRTNDASGLSSLYANSFVFVNPTWQDNFPTTNIEALACGTPVITYQTGGSPEAVDSETGAVVAKGDVVGIWNAIKEFALKDQAKLRAGCRQRALAMFDKDLRFNDYLSLYKQLTSTNT